MEIEIWCKDNELNEQYIERNEFLEMDTSYLSDASFTLKKYVYEIQTEYI